MRAWFWGHKKHAPYHCRAAAQGQAELPGDEECSGLGRPEGVALPEPADGFGGAGLRGRRRGLGDRRAPGEGAEDGVDLRRSGGELVGRQDPRPEVGGRGPEPRRVGAEGVADGGDRT